MGVSMIESYGEKKAPGYFLADSANTSTICCPPKNGSGAVSVLSVYVAGVDGNSTGSRNAWAWFFADSSQLMNANAAFGFLQYFVIARKDPPLLPAPPGAAVTRQSPLVFGAAFFGPSCAHQTAALYATSLPLVTTAFLSVEFCALAESPSLTTRTARSKASRTWSWSPMYCPSAVM